MLWRELIIDEEDAEFDFSNVVHLLDQLEPEDLRGSSRVEREPSTVDEEQNDFVFGAYTIESISKP